MTVFWKNEFEKYNRKASNDLDKASEIDLLIGTINTFITDSKSHLKGNGYDALRDMLSYQCEFLEYIRDLSLLSYEKVTEMTSKAIIFMDEYNYLNDTFLDSIKSEITRCKNNISVLDDLIISPPDDTDYASKKKYYEFLLSQLEPRAKKLELLKPTDHEIASTSSELLHLEEKFINKVGSLKVIRIKKGRGIF